MTDTQEQQRAYKAFLRERNISQHGAIPVASRIITELETLTRRGDRLHAQADAATDDVTRRRVEGKLADIEDRELQLGELLDQFPPEHVEATLARRQSHYNRNRR